MSGKYSLVNAAYTPNTVAITRGELVFKATYKQTGKQLEFRDTTDEIAKGFWSGRENESGWTGAASANKAQLANFVAHSRYEGTQSNLTTPGAQRVVQAIKDLANDNDDLAIRIRKLYSRVYTITVKDDSGVTTLDLGDHTKIAPLQALDASNALIRAAAGTDAAGTVGVEFTTDGTSQASQNYGSGATNYGGEDLGSITAAADVASNILPFDWNLGKLTAFALSSVKSTSGADAYSALISSVTGPKFDKTVERDAKGGLVIVDKDGKQHPITEWAAKRTACANTGIGKDETDCASMISTCLKENKDGNPNALLSGDCRKAIKATADKTNTRDLVKGMNPQAAFRLLKNLGLKGKKVDGLVRCEPYDEFAKRVEDDKVTKDDKSSVDLATAAPATGGASTHGLDAGGAGSVKAFVKDEKVKDFIGLIIGFIDSNKAILNKGASAGISSGYDVNDPFGRKRPRGNDKDGDLSDARVVIEGSLHNMHNHVLRLLGNMQIVSPNAISLLGMVGGSAMTTSAPTYVVQPHSGRKLIVPRFSDRLKEIYEHYLSRLKSMNKDLSEATKSKVGSVLDHVKEKEDELMKWVEYLQRYYEVSQLEGDLSTGEVGEQELKSAYQKYEKNLVKLRKRSINFIDILSTLSTATNDAESGIDTNLPSSI